MVRYLILTALLVAAVACGSGGGGYGGGGDGGDGGGEPDPAYDAVAPSIASACGKCHNGTVHPLNLKNRGVLQNSKAKVKTRVSNGSMPPAGNAITAEEKAAILDYVD